MAYMKVWRIGGSGGGCVASPLRQAQDMLEPSKHDLDAVSVAVGLFAVAELRPDESGTVIPPLAAPASPGATAALPFATLTNPVPTSVLLRVTSAT